MMNLLYLQKLFHYNFQDKPNKFKELSGIGEQGELADYQHLAFDILNGKIEFAVRVSKNA